MRFLRDYLEVGRKEVYPALKSMFGVRRGRSSTLSG